MSQPRALQLADLFSDDDWFSEAVDELRRQHAEIQEQAATIENLWEQLVARVPDGLPPYEQPEGADYGESHEAGYIDGWNACRAAMLSAAPSQQARVPDGSVLVDRGALNTAINMLRRDAANGMQARGELVELLDTAKKFAPPPSEH